MLPMVFQRWWTEEQRKQHEAKVGPSVWKYVEDVYGKDVSVPMDWTAILSTAQKPKLMALLLVYLNFSYTNEKIHHRLPDF